MRGPICLLLAHSKNQYGKHSEVAFPCKVLTIASDTQPPNIVHIMLSTFSDIVVLSRSADDGYAIVYR
jgi:hypothetical protein